MQLAPAQLTAHLQKGLRPIYTLYGDEALLQQEAADAIRTTARAQGFTERQVFTVAGAHFDWSGVQSAAGALSLFADRQIIELRIPSGKPGKEGSVALQQLAQSLEGADTTLLLVTLPRLDKATRTSAWFTALDNHGVSVAVETLDRSALPVWIAQRLARQQQRVQRPVAFVHRQWLREVVEVSVEIDVLVRGAPHMRKPVGVERVDVQHRHAAAGHLRTQGSVAQRSHLHATAAVTLYTVAGAADDQHRCGVGWAVAHHVHRQIFPVAALERVQMRLHRQPRIARGRQKLVARLGVAVAEGGLDLRVGCRLAQDRVVRVVRVMPGC